MELRLRLSLLGRMAFALGVLGTLTLAVLALFTLPGAVVGYYLYSLLVGSGLWVVERAAGLPRLSPVVGLPAWAVAVASAAGFAALWRSPGDWLADHVPFGGWAFLLGVLVGLYLVVVEGSAAVRSLTWPLGTLGTALAVLALGTLVVFRVTVAQAREELDRLRERLHEESVPAEESHPDLVPTVRRLAQQADVPAPTVHVVERDRPESYTLGNGSGAMLVVSTGLLELLEPAEREAVLAHELSHLLNRDSQVMELALTPVLVAAGEVEACDDDERFWRTVFAGLQSYGQLGVAVLSRGREFAADAGAAALTGSPATLASALATLDRARGVPDTDLREWEQHAAALDILPPVDREAATGPFRTHPSTSARIDHLQRLADRMETDDHPR